MKAGKAKDGKAIDLATVFEAVGQVSANKMSLETLQDIEENACPTCGSCSGMFTANSMNCLNEALGLALPGNGSILATDPARDELFAEAGRRIVDLVKDNIRPSDILTRKCVRERLRPGRGHGRQHQHGAAHAGRGHRGRARRSRWRT